MPEVKLTVFLFLCAIPAAAALRLGIVGTDTSHVTAFAEILNNESSPDHLGGADDDTSQAAGIDDLRAPW
jgi:hypothetical protein